jgi:hypothetical protein
MKKDQQRIIEDILKNIFSKEDNVKSYILKPESIKKDQSLVSKKLVLSSRKVNVQEYFPRIIDQFKTLSLPFQIELFDSKQIDEKLKRNKIPF